MPATPTSRPLFSLAAPDEQVFREVLDQYFAGATDEGTTSRLSPPARS